MKKQKGFSIAECVIAMAVILIVSVAAYSVISMSITKNKDAVAFEEIVLAGENAREYYRFSGTLGDFEEETTIGKYTLKISAEGDEFNAWICEEGKDETILLYGEEACENEVNP